jgi:hypothetical protein
MSPMRYGLRTLLIVLAMGPPVLAAEWRYWHRVNWSEAVANAKCVSSHQVGLVSADKMPATLTGVHSVPSGSGLVRLRSESPPDP